MKNPFGYTIAVALEYLFTTNIWIPALCLLSFAFGTCLTLISLTEDIKCDVDGLNASARAKDDKLKIATKFFQLIEFHSDARQFSGSYKCSSHFE